MQQAGDSELTLRPGEHAGAGLHGAEQHAYQGLGEEEHDERGGDQAPGPVVVLVLGQLRRAVQREPGAEDQQQPRREADGRPRADERDDHADQGRTGHVRRLVGRPLVGERRLDQAPLALALGEGDRRPAHSGQRADLRHEEPGRGGGDDEHRGAGVASGQRDQQEQQQPAAHRL